MIRYYKYIELVAQVALLTLVFIAGYIWGGRSIVERSPLLQVQVPSHSHLVVVET